MPALPGPEITIQPLRPPLGGVYHFAANIGQLFRTRNGARERVRLPLVEVWGETEDDARNKAEAIIARLFGDASTARGHAPSLRDVPAGTGEQTGGR